MKTVGDLRTLYERIRRMRRAERGRGARAVVGDDHADRGAPETARVARRDGEAGEILCERIASGLIEA